MKPENSTDSARGAAPRPNPMTVLVLLPWLSRYGHLNILTFREMQSLYGSITPRLTPQAHARVGGLFQAWRAFSAPTAATHEVPLPLVA